MEARESDLYEIESQSQLSSARSILSKHSAKSVVLKPSTVKRKARKVIFWTPVVVAGTMQSQVAMSKIEYQSTQQLH